MSANRNSKYFSLNPIRIGLFLTCLVIVIFVWLSLRNHCAELPSGSYSCTSNIQWFLNSSPNEIGDTLAGFAGSLAFIWIVVTVWLQSNELAEQREVLREQKEEFKLMVAAQDAQVTALNAQADIFRSEQKDRLELKTDKVLEEKFKTLWLFIAECAFADLQWTIVGAEHLGPMDPPGTRNFFHFFYKGDDFESFISSFARGMEQGRASAILQSATAGFSQMPVCPRADFEKVVERIYEITSLSQESSGEMRERISRMNLGNLASVLYNIAHLKLIWTTTTVVELAR